MLEITFITVLGQILLPLAFVIRLWRVACRRAALLICALSAGCYLALVAAVGVWLLVPWYLPCGFALLALAAAAATWRRCGRSLPPRQTRFRSGFHTGCAATMAVFCASMLAWALNGYDPPLGPSLSLSLPLKNGVFYVVNGGYSILINPHMKTLDRESLAAYRGQSYAVDIVRLDRFGRRADGWWPAELSRYHVFGEPVYAPCSGVVVRTEDRLPDLTPPDCDRQYPAGNFVLMECTEAAVFLAHLMQSSVSVSPGQWVPEGERIGRVGNSGLSLEPHLHLHVQRPNNAHDFLNAAPLPFRIDGQVPVRNTRFHSGR